MDGSLRTQLKQTQTVRVDPRLILANTVLQKSSLELEDHIQVELSENPALEISDDHTNCDGSCIDPRSCPDCSQGDPKAFEIGIGLDVDREVLFESELPANQEDIDPLLNIAVRVTLTDHLVGQLVEFVSPPDRALAEYLIFALDDRGFFTLMPEEVTEALGIPASTVLRVLESIQRMNPAGVGARNVQECLLLQLRDRRESGITDPLAERIVRYGFDELASGKLSRLARAWCVPLSQIETAAQFIKASLAPYPAAMYRESRTGQTGSIRVRPDVIVRRSELGYEIEVVGADSVTLNVSPAYRQAYDRIRSGKLKAGEDERRQIVDYVERADLLIKNIYQRRRTLRLITQCILECQLGYIETGSKQFLRPLTRANVAQTLYMHESTISRATARKYLQLPNGDLVSFSHFFDASLSVKSYIEEMIAAEDPSRPLSDREITESLNSRGIPVARRTVMKYRTAQKLLSSSARRRPAASLAAAAR